MYAFNAIQIVALYASLPFLFQYAASQDWLLAKIGIGVLFLIGSIFLIVGATNNLYAIDKELRGSR